MDAATVGISQDGTQNEAIATQERGTGGMIEIDQTGAGNFADVFQQREDGQSPVRTMTRVVQEGTLNEVIVDQISSENARTDVLQLGDRNSASVTQFNGAGIDPNHQAFIRQEGTENLATIDQSADQVSAVNSAQIVQLGVSNVARLDQDGRTGGHAAGVRQEGTDNVLQGIDGNSFAFQAGDDHALTVDQAGEMNLAQVSQAGAGNTASLAQTGTGNTTVVIQQ